MEEASYETLLCPVSFELKEKGSKFLAFAYPVKDEEAIKICLDELKTSYPDATHHCYAYKLFDAYRANDDGEPKNSAGLPIYRQILSENLEGTLVVVVRYYGGKKLGVAGLVKAYGEAAKQCLLSAERTVTIPTYKYTIKCETNFQYLVYEFCNRLNVQPELINNTQFTFSIESKMTSKIEELCEIYPTLEVYLDQ
jgi:putative IMPACT (imprinted ancient) family translation regulator